MADSTISSMVRLSRRARASLPDADTQPPAQPPDKPITDLWGMALSGGGIRSATFALGLLSALSRNKSLQRFDLMSTVSGGGYCGAMLGRLLMRSPDAATTRQALDSLADAPAKEFGQWLRANGRYLIPAGWRDAVFALVMYLRNMIGVHAVLAMIAGAIGLVLSAINLLVWQCLANGLSPGHWIQPMLVPWLPTLWLIGFPLLAWPATVLTYAYWAEYPAWEHPRRTIFLTLAFSAFVIGIWMLNPLVAPGNPFQSISGHWVHDLALVLTGWLLSGAIAGSVLTSALMWHQQGRVRNRLEPASFGAQTVRTRLTKLLSGVAQVLIFVAVLGALDRAAWWLAFDLGEMDTNTVPIAALLTAVASGLTRLSLPHVAERTKHRASPGTLLRLASGAGYLLTFVLAACWIAAIYRFVMADFVAPDALHQAGPLDFGSAWYAWGPAMGVLLCFWLFFGSSIRFLNLSSLHFFYCARLVRSYLGASNPHRFGGPATTSPLVAINDIGQARSGESPKLRDVDAQDDIAMGAYMPHATGGAVHLINMCLNEGASAYGHGFNRDRRGTLLTVTHGGFIRAGVDSGWQRMSTEPGSLTLGGWAAISGAAIAPGLGAYTRGGISALLMFAGIRLGYWFKARHRDGTSLWNPLHESRTILHETLGIFHGRNDHHWYLSDGGHFENTGTYALLAQRARLIVVSDAAADPDYAFNDLAEMVRKARIDLQADVTFLKPRRDATELAVDAQGVEGLYRAIGSLSALANPQNDTCLALARVHYRHEPDMPDGYLLLVKPNLTQGLPIDVEQYKRDHPSFPQDTTIDQFFGEAQWESYRRLGEHLGHWLTKPALDHLLHNAHLRFEPDPDALPVLQPNNPERPQGTANAASSSTRAKFAGLTSAPLATSLGLGAALAAGITAWQGIDLIRSGLTEQQKARTTALKELTDTWLKSRTEDPQALAAHLTRLADSMCKSAEDTGWLLESPMARDALSDALAACRTSASLRNGGPDGKVDACVTLINLTTKNNTGQANCLMRASTMLNETRAATRPDAKPGCPRYWGYDYRMHPGTSCLPPARHAESQGTDPATFLHTWPAIAASGQPVAETPDPTLRNVCAGARIHVQIHDATSIDHVRPEWRVQWMHLGARVAPIEDVHASARLSGWPLPQLPREKPVIRYHDPSSRGCAEAMAKHASPSKEERWRIEPLARPIVPTKGVVEVWLPRGK